MNVDQILDKLERVKGNSPRRMALCPAHADLNPSLSVCETDDRVLLHCHAGCSIDKVLEALGLAERDLFFTPRKNTSTKTIETVYPYTDEHGAPLYEGVRFRPKGFAQRKANGAGGYVWKLGQTRRVPYRLPGLVAGIAAGQTVLIVEGEKDVDRLVGQGFVATCNSGGAGKWRAEWSPWFAGASVVILPDNDTPGTEHAAQVMTMLGAVADVRVVTLPDLPVSGDVSDWLDAGGTRDVLDQLIANAATPPPAPPENGADLLDAVTEFLALYVAYPSVDALHASALWVAHCHALDCFDSTPRLAMLSPEPGSGKTRALEVIELLAPDAMHALNASAPPIFRSIEKQRPTLLFDEVDALFGRRGKDDSAEDLRALLNAGHRTGATIPRCVGPTHEVAQFPVFAAVALAGLGDLPDTLMTRSIVVRMRRRAPSEHVAPFRYRIAAPDGHDLRDRLAGWVSANTAKFEQFPVMPPGVEDRNADCWEPLLAVADAAGGHWPETARAACVELVKVVTSREASLGVRLLVDLREVFGDAQTLGTETILRRLRDLEESPWSDLRGRVLDARGLAWRLGQYGVTSAKVKIDGVSVRGYRREDLWDAWTRYLPAPTPEEAEPAEPPEPGRSEAMFQVPFGFEGPEPAEPGGAEVPEPDPAPEPFAPPLTCEVPEVPEVPDLRAEDRADACVRCGTTATRFVPHYETGALYCSACCQAIDPGDTS